MPPETIQNTNAGETLISPERKKQIRDDLTYFQLFAFQGPRITTGDGKRPLGQLNETDVSYEYSFGGGEWNNLAIAMGNHGYVSGQLSPEAEGIIDRFFPLIDPVCPAILQEKNGLIVLETASDDGKISVLMVGYANYELVRGRSPIPTGFELIFSDLGAANRFFKGLENDPTTAINEYVSAAIGGIEDGRHAAFGGKYPSIGYLGVRRYNDEMYQAGVTIRGVKRVNSWKGMSEFVDFEENHKQEKIDSIDRPDQNSLLPEIRYKGYDGYSSFFRPAGYFSVVAAVDNRQSSEYYKNMSEIQRNAPAPAEALTPPGFRRINTPGEMGFMAPGNEARQIIFGLSHPAFVVKSGERCLLSVGFPFSPVDSGTGQKLSDLNWVGIKEGYQVMVRRGEGNRLFVGTDDKSKTITVSFPPEFTGKDGRKYDFSDIKGGVNKQEYHCVLRLAQSGSVQIENWDSKFGMAVPAESAASAAQAGERDARKEGDEATEKLQFEIGAATHVGKVREHNEDSLAVMGASAFGEKFKADSGLYVVADGMGGHGAGEVASALAVEAVQKGYLAGPRAGENDQAFLKRLVSEANGAVFAKRRNSQGDEASMGTTIVAALRHGERTVLAWVGDSRAYRIKPDGIVERLTTDHSLVQRLVDTDQITPAEAAVHPQRNVIYRTLGDKPMVEVDAVTADLKPGDSLLLCCDGLSGMVSDAEMARIVNQAGTSQAAAEQLIAAANAAGGQDNISAIVVGHAPESKPVDEGKIRVEQTINNIAAEISGGNPDRQRLQQLITELLSGAAALAADRQKLNKTMAFALKVAQKYQLDFGKS